MEDYFILFGEVSVVLGMQEGPSVYVKGLLREKFVEGPEAL